jgi:UDP-2,3-diacylglucosamine pyrophosphatase LpxH
VLSDLHLGDPRVDDKTTLRSLYNVIQTEQPDLLVLAGDVLEGNLASTDTVKQLTALCHMVTETIVLVGNHDGAETTAFANSLPCSIGTTLVGDCGVAPFAVEHGDRFAGWQGPAGWFGKVGIWLQHVVYRWFKIDLQGWFRRFRCVQKKLLAQHAKAWDAWVSKVVIVVTGHTHLPTGTDTGFGYFNSGDWVQHRSYVVMDRGKARLVRLS